MNTLSQPVSTTKFVSKGSLWAKESTTGKLFLSGSIELDKLQTVDKVDKQTGQVIKVAYITIFDIEKPSPNAPGYRIYQSEEIKPFINLQKEDLDLSLSENDDDEVNF